MLRLFKIDGFFTMEFNRPEDEVIIIQAERTPSKEQVERILTDSFYRGTFYADDVVEVKEKDIRNIKTEFVRIER